MGASKCGSSDRTHPFHPKKSLTVSKNFSPRCFAAAIAASLTIFLIDCVCELGVSVSGLYALVVFFALVCQHTTTVVAVAVVCSALTVLGCFLSPKGSELWVVLANRSMSVLAIWLIASVGLQRGKLETRLRDLAAQEAVRVKEAVAEERLRQIVEHIREVFWITTSDGEAMEYVSPAYEAIWGRSCDSLYEDPKNWIAHIHPDDRERVEADFFQNAAMGGFDTEYRIVRPDGTERWIRDRGFPVKNETGAVYRIAGIAEDITKQKNIERELRTAMVAARAAADAKTTFLASMSHEIRTPMNAVLGMTQILRDENLTASQREHLSVLKHSAESLLAVIEDILDFAKIQAGKLKLEEVAFDMRELLGDTMKAFARRAQVKRLEIASRISPALPTLVVGDRLRLRQIVANLVSNAIKFTERGEVVLNAQCVWRGTTDALIHISVTDTGCGIPEKRQKRILGAFEKAESDLRHYSGGTGLGLAISSRLVEMMGGKMVIESQVGKGTKVHFTVKFKVAEGTTLDQLGPAALEDLHSLRVLIVDDREVNCEILREITASWGMRPVICTDPLEVRNRLLEAIEFEDPFKLLVTDMNMPKLDGLSLVRSIREHKQLAELAVIMDISDDSPEAIRQCEELGVTAYLVKPVKQSELLEALAVALHLTAVESSDSALDLAERKQPLRILLAEDSLINQKVAMGLLKKFGHEIIVAGDGREAFDKYQTEDYDVVLMDVQMPEMDGLEATMAIRDFEKKTGRHTPIIALTAQVMEGDREKCLEAGMDEYVAKPIRAKELEDAIQRMTTAFPVSSSGHPQRKTTVAGMGESDIAKNGAVVVPLIDWPAVLRSVGDDRRLLIDVINLLDVEAPKLMTEIENAITAADAPTLQRASHTLKGSLRIFGAEKASALAFRLETCGRDSQLESAVEFFEELKPAIIALLEETGRFADDG